jgi:phosphate starvation-inducible PhoH-like protein
LELTITLDERSDRAALFGTADRHLRLIRGALGVRISARDSNLRLAGEASAVGKAAAVIDRLQQVLRETDRLSEEAVVDAIAEAAREDARGAEVSDRIDVYSKHVAVVPKTDGQRAYIQAISEFDLVFCLGPAGTGKTYLAVAMGVAMLKSGQIKRIVLVRPAVEAGEKLGFLPGDLQAKVNPYLRPLFDAMHDMMTFDQIRRFMQNDVIEVIPLAFMRGRTLNSSAVILDEAQNTTVSQMLMFLTRLGHNSKMIVTGDDSQIDLEASQRSGLIDAVQRLRGIHGIGVVRLNELDIVRHKLVQNIVNAYADGRGGAHYRTYKGKGTGNRQSGSDPADG